jgi:hypothetical protein
MRVMPQNVKDIEARLNFESGPANHLRAFLIVSNGRLNIVAAAGRMDIFDDMSGQSYELGGICLTELMALYFP